MVIDTTIRVYSLAVKCALPLWADVEPVMCDHGQPLGTFNITVVCSSFFHMGPLDINNVALEAFHSF